MENFLILHGKSRCRNFHGIPWKFFVLMFSMEFHGICPNPPCKYFPLKSMGKFPWNSMEIDVPGRFFTREVHTGHHTQRKTMSPCSKS